VDDSKILLLKEIFNFEIPCSCSSSLVPCIKDSPGSSQIPALETVPATLTYMGFDLFQTDPAGHLHRKHDIGYDNRQTVSIFLMLVP